MLVSVVQVPKLPLCVLISTSTGAFHLAPTQSTALTPNRIPIYDFLEGHLAQSSPVALLLKGCLSTTPMWGNKGKAHW